MRNEIITIVFVLLIQILRSYADTAITIYHIQILMNIDGNLLKIPTYHPQKVQRDEEQ
jgi:hypothetical protein